MKYPTHIYGLYLALVLLTCLEVGLQHLDYLRQDCVFINFYPHM